DANGPFLRSGSSVLPGACTPAEGRIAADRSRARGVGCVQQERRFTPWHRAPLSGSTLRRALVSSPRTAAAPTCLFTTPRSTPPATGPSTRRSASSSKSPRARRARRPTAFAPSDQRSTWRGDNRRDNREGPPPGWCGPFVVPDRGEGDLDGREVAGYAVRCCLEASPRGLWRRTANAVRVHPRRGFKSLRLRATGAPEPLGPGAPAIPRGGRPLHPAAGPLRCRRSRPGRSDFVVGGRTGYSLCLSPSRRRAPVAQRIEHLTTDQKVWGSNPYRRALCADSNENGPAETELPGRSRVSARESTTKGVTPGSTRGHPLR